MTAGNVSRRVVLARLQFIDKMLSELHNLPLESSSAFTSDSRNVHTAESCLRRSLEALMDIGRHILAKGYGIGVSEYRGIATELTRLEILTATEGEFLRLMAGYRNRLTQLYHDVTAEELYGICRDRLDEVGQIRSAFQRWLRANQDRTSEE